MIKTIFNHLIFCSINGTQSLIFPFLALKNDESKMTNISKKGVSFAEIGAMVMVIVASDPQILIKVSCSFPLCKK